MLVHANICDTTKGHAQEHEASGSRSTGTGVRSDCVVQPVGQSTVQSVISAVGVRGVRPDTLLKPEGIKGSGQVKTRTASNQFSSQL